MDKGLHITSPGTEAPEIRRSALGLALAHIARPQLGKSALDLFRLRSAASDTSPSIIANSLANQHQITIDWPEVDRTLQWVDAEQNHLLIAGDEAFPPLLANIADAPNLLFVKGNPALLRCPQVAIVGSRKATHYGLANARDIASELAHHGLVVTSGLALGIDGECHRAALEANTSTIAVVGTGIEENYPRQHLKLRRAIAAEGALVSEFPLGAVARPFHFPRRNRIISGLSIAVIVIEATLKSGSLTTANHAAEQGREVFAVPGSIRHPSAAGCHKLLNDGAAIVQNADELMFAIDDCCRTFFPDYVPATNNRSLKMINGKKTYPNVSKNARLVLEKMGGEAIQFDELVDACGLTSSELSSILSALELDGYIRSTPGNTFVAL